MTLKKDRSLFKVDSSVLNPYEKHFLLENPFPGHGETRSDVCTDQEDIKEKYVYTLRNFSDTAKRLRINGENGAGKTNILRYFERLTNDARESKLIGNFRPIYVYAPGENYFDIHGQIVDKLTGFFLNDLIEILKPDSDLINRLSLKVKPASELLIAISAITQSITKDYRPIVERQKDIFIRWMKGQKLTAADKNLLIYEGVTPVDITSPSLAMRFLYGLLGVLKELKMCDGIILLFDEFEEIFEGLTRARQSRYAQDLRHLFDILKESVFFVIATVPEPKDLAQYPAIERRLGKIAELQSIDSIERATNYVLDYLESGRDEYETYQNQDVLNRPDGLKPLTEKIVEEEYFSLKEQVEKAELKVLPGYFLPKMRERIKQIVENGN